MLVPGPKRSHHEVWLQFAEQSRSVCLPATQRPRHLELLLLLDGS